jgi:hypothetical protein
MKRATIALLLFSLAIRSSPGDSNLSVTSNGNTHAYERLRKKKMKSCDGD